MGKRATSIQINPDDESLIEKLGGTTKAVETLANYWKETHDVHVTVPDLYPDWLIAKAGTEKSLFLYLEGIAGNPDNERITRYLFSLYHEPGMFRPYVDPESPFFREFVASALREKLRHAEVRESTTELENKSASLTREIALLEQDKNRLESGNLELEATIDNLSRKSSDLREDKGMKMVDEFYANVGRFASAVLDTGDLSDMGNFTKQVLKRRELNPDQVQTLTMILQKSREDMEYLKTEEFLSGAVRDEKRAELKKEMDQIKAAVEAFRDRNPDAILDRLRKNIDRLRAREAKGGRYISEFMDELIAIDNDTEKLISMREKGK